MKESKRRKDLVEQALVKVGSRYLVCSLVSKRTNQIIRNAETPGVGTSINQALHDLLEDRVQYQMTTSV